MEATHHQTENKTFVRIYLEITNFEPSNKRLYGAAKIKHNDGHLNCE